MEEAQGQRPERPVTERAEELADRLGQRAGYFVSLAGRRLQKMTALAREEAEDIWAEAQSIRRREQL